MRLGIPVRLLLSPVLPGLLLLSSCGIFQPTSRTPEAECRFQANKDQKVMDLEVKQFSQTPSDPDIRPDIAVARNEAYQRCLQNRGLAPPGGVEPVRPRY